MKLLTNDAARTSWVCPVCGKSMASEGGFKIHLSGNHPGLTPSGAAINRDTVSEAAPAEAIETKAPRRSTRTPWRPPEPEPEVAPAPPPTVADDPLLSGTRLSPRSMSGTWVVSIAAEGEGTAVSAELAEAFRSALRDTGARVSISTESAKTCHYSADISVEADGALTAVLHGISHFQTAARLARLPAVRIVGVNARDGGGSLADR